MTFKHIPEEARAAWIEDLRSGNFKQLSCQLKGRDQNEDVAHCCLGVATETFLRLEGVGHWNGDKFVQPDNNDYSASLPDIVRDWLGLSSNIGRLTQLIHTSTGACWDLTQLNDGANFTFNQIADVIEEGKVILA